jgi:hypothetical protein
MSGSETHHLAVIAAARRWVLRSLSSGRPGVPIALARWGCPASGRTRWFNPSYGLADIAPTFRSFEWHT